ncbi:MAG: hypothetical protein WBE46_06235 [Dehalococcoidia bacterium]
MKKILLICLALVLALGSLGVAGALWSDWLYIDGYVETGYIGAEWSVEAVYDNEQKDFSYIDAWWSGDTMYIDIYNAYPSVTYTVEWNIECTGSVPIHFDYPWFFGDLGPEYLTFTDMAGVPIDWPTVQLHQGDVLYGLLTVHLDNSFEQDSWYYFYIELEYGQYNEFPD